MRACAHQRQDESVATTDISVCIACSWVGPDTNLKLPKKMEQAIAPRSRLKLKPLSTNSALISAIGPSSLYRPISVSGPSDGKT